MKMPNTVSSKSGFSLIEVIIAISLLAFMMIGVYSVVDNASQSRDSIYGEDRDLVDVERALGRMEVDFSLIYSPLYFDYSAQEASKVKRTIPNTSTESTNPYEENPGVKKTSKAFPVYSSKGLPAPLFDNPKKGEVIFLTSTHRRVIPNNKESIFSWLRYSIRNMPDEKVKFPEANDEIVRQSNPENPYLGDFDWDDISSQVLLRHVSELKFEFWSPKRERFVDTLQEVDDPNRIRFVRLTIKRKDSRGFDQEITRTFRVLWPSFDPTQDLVDESKANAKSTTPQEGGPPLE